MHVYTRTLGVGISTGPMIQYYHDTDVTARYYHKIVMLYTIICDIVFFACFNSKASPRSNILSTSVISNENRVFSLCISLHEHLLQQSGAKQAGGLTRTAVNVPSSQTKLLFFPSTIHSLNTLNANLSELRCQLIINLVT